MKPIPERVEEFFVTQNEIWESPLLFADAKKAERKELLTLLTETDQQAREEERARIAMLTSGLTFTQMIDSISSKTHVDGVELHRVIKSSIETALEITDPSLFNPPSQV